MADLKKMTLREAGKHWGDKARRDADPESALLALAGCFMLDAWPASFDLAVLHWTGRPGLVDALSTAGVDQVRAAVTEALSKASADGPRLGDGFVHVLGSHLALGASWQDALAEAKKALPAGTREDPAVLVSAMRAGFSTVIRELLKSRPAAK